MFHSLQFLPAFLFFFLQILLSRHAQIVLLINQKTLLSFLRANNIAIWANILIFWSNTLLNSTVLNWSVCTGLGLEGTVGHHLMGTRISSARSGCPWPHPTWLWMLSGMGHPRLLWAACFIVLPFSWKVFLDYKSESALFKLRTVIPCPVATGPVRKSLCILETPFKYWKVTVRSPQILLQSEQPQLSAFF